MHTKIATAILFLASGYLGSTLVEEVKHQEAIINNEKRIQLSLQAYDGKYWQEVLDMKASGLEIGQVQKKREGKFRIVVKEKGSGEIVTELYRRR